MRGWVIVYIAILCLMMRSLLTSSQSLQGGSPHLLGTWEWLSMATMVSSPSGQVMLPGSGDYRTEMTSWIFLSLAGVKTVCHLDLLQSEECWLRNQNSLDPNTPSSATCQHCNPRSVTDLTFLAFPLPPVMRENSDRHHKGLMRIK